MTKIRFLETSVHGMRWMKQYFKIQNQLNNTAAFTSFSKARAFLKLEPLAEHRCDDLENVRELKIRNSTFRSYTPIKTIQFISLMFGTNGAQDAPKPCKNLPSQSSVYF